MKRLIGYLAENNVKLPSGGNFSVLRLRQLGYYFGFHGQSPLVLLQPWLISGAGTMDLVHGQ